MTRFVRRREVLGLVACAGSAALLLGSWPDRGPSNSSGAATTPDAASGSSGTSVAAPDRPASLTIPAVDLDEPVRALGLTDAGEIEPPSGVVQWYTGSVAPGESGVAVIAGHVSSPRPDVFERLGELGAGDRVDVTAASGEELSFVVERTKRVDKADLTRDPTVWGEEDRRMLVLITCDDESGITDGHYRGNTVVWAEAEGPTA